MIKKLAIILTALLLCSCSNNQSEAVTSATSDGNITTNVISETKPETCENQQKITELELDLNNDGINEKIVLKPDAENDNSRLYCYDCNGILIGGISGEDWYQQMTELTLKWYDDGENIYPALLSTYENDFFYGDYTLKLYIKDGKFCIDRILQTGGLRENYGPILDPDYYSDIYGDWISETQYNKYKAMIYDNIEDTPNYKKICL